MRSDLVNALIGTVEPNYKPTDTDLYGIDVVSMMVKGTQLKGIYDIYATIDLAEYLCKVNETQEKLNDLHTFLGGIVPTWAFITNREYACGALASALVNLPLYTDSAFKYNHAYYFDLETVKILDAQRPQTEYNIALALREL